MKLIVFLFYLFSLSCTLQPTQLTATDKTGSVQVDLNSSSTADLVRTLYDNHLQGSIENSVLTWKEADSVSQKTATTALLSNNAITYSLSGGRLGR